MGDGGCPATMGMAREYRGNHSLEKEGSRNAGKFIFLLVIFRG
jgi:hypothetical protein